MNDAVTSAFNAAGQRCSALRVLFVQEDIAPRVLELLAGVMDTLAIGDPALLSTDVGPVIDAHALRDPRGARPRNRRRARAGTIVRGFRPRWRAGTASRRSRSRSTASRASSARSSARSCTSCASAGPRIEEVVDEINASGYGLTLGVHTRIDSVARRIAARARVGNVYVNRNMIGAVVGVQPFGGCGLSGTGPKAGGPHYLPRFATEQTVTINTAAVGGNATLLSLGRELDRGRGFGTGGSRKGPRPAERLHHPRLQPRRLRHHRLVPRRVEDELDVGIADRRDQLELVADVGDEHLAHAAAGRGERHLHGDVARAVRIGRDLALVDEPEVDDVDRDLGVEAGAQLVPDDPVDVLVRSRPPAAAGGRSGSLPIASPSTPAMRNRLPST